MRSSVSGSRSALGRSNRLVSGTGWPDFGVVYTTTLLNAIATLALIPIFSFLPTFLAVWIGGVVAPCLVVPFVALAWTVTYFELRRREPAAAVAA
jgi:hypothetical protein